MDATVSIAATHLRSLAARASRAAGRTSDPSPVSAPGSPPRSAPAQSPCHRRSVVIIQNNCLVTLKELGDVPEVGHDRPTRHHEPELRDARHVHLACRFKQNGITSCWSDAGVAALCAVAATEKLHWRPPRRSINASLLASACRPSPVSRSATVAIAQGLTQCSRPLFAAFCPHNAGRFSKSLSSGIF